MRAITYRPDFTWVAGRVVEGAPLHVAQDGRVVAEAPAGAEEVRLAGQVLLPGLVNAHSHAFQRVLRGRTEYLAPGRERDDFWSWRELMYRAAERLSPDDLYVVSRQAYAEMARAGITTVGEFHYLHHAPGGARYADPNELSLQVIRAARDVGLRIVLLRVVYARGGHGRALVEAQRRFVEPDVETALSNVEALASATRGDERVSVGVAPHSVRALPLTWLTELARADLPLVHMHVAEQPGEVEACLAEHGRRPVELLDEVGLLSPRFTAIHGIHLSESEVARLARAGAGVCACPSTEANLGDGVVEADRLAEARVPLSLGSDSQAHIDLLADARALEDHLRLVRHRRAVLADARGDVSALASRLLAFASRGGARALGLPTGDLEPGSPADFFTLDLGDSTLAGVPPALASMVADASCVREVAVGGRLLMSGSSEVEQGAGRESYRVLLQRLFA